MYSTQVLSMINAKLCWVRESPHGAEAAAVVAGAADAMALPEKTLRVSSAMVVAPARSKRRVIEPVIKGSSRSRVKQIDWRDGATAEGVPRGRKNRHWPPRPSYVCGKSSPGWSQPEQQGDHPQPVEATHAADRLTSSR